MRYNLPTFKRTWFVAILSSLLMAGVGCGDADADGDGLSNNANNNAGEMATVTGRLDSNDMEGEGLEASGAIVAAYEVSANGELTLVSDGTTEVDSSGHYSVSIDMSLFASGDLIIEAQKESEAYGSVLVNGAIEAGQTIQAAPITARTTVQADVYLEARASSSWDDRCTLSQHRDLVSAELAASLRASAEAEYQSSVESVSQASTCAMKAWSEFLVEKSAATRAELDAVFAAQAEARASLDAELHAGADAEQARETYASAVLAAYTEANITTKERARASHAAAEGMLTYSAELSGEARARAEADAEAFRATHVTAGIESSFEALGYAKAESEHAAVVQAGVDLKAELAAAAQGQGSGAAAAWANYRAEVESQLNASHSAALASLDTSAAVDAMVSGLASLSASSDTSASAEAAVNAVAEFYGTIDAHTGDLSTDGLLDVGADAEVLLEILFSLELCTR